MELEMLFVRQLSLGTNTLIIYGGYRWPCRRKWTRVEDLVVERGHVRVKTLCLGIGSSIANVLTVCSFSYWPPLAVPPIAKSSKRLFEVCQKHLGTPLRATVWEIIVSTELEVLAEHLRCF